MSHRYKRQKLSVNALNTIATVEGGEAGEEGEQQGRQGQGGDADAIAVKEADEARTGESRFQEDHRIVVAAGSVAIRDLMNAESGDEMRGRYTGKGKAKMEAEELEGEDEDSRTEHGEQQKPSDEFGWSAGKGAVDGNEARHHGLQHEPRKGSTEEDGHEAAPSGPA